MAKVSKSVREKRKDFAKTKLKVGKSKQLPSNHTDTSFRSKAVALPKQSTTQDVSVKESHTLSHLLALLSHKHGDTRRDTLQQLTVYLNIHPPQLSTTITPLLKALAPLIIDDTTAVRRNLLDLFDTILSRVPSQALNSHVDLLLLYISSAMTHISPTIRADSTKFLLWAFRATNTIEVVVASQLKRFLSTFSTLFGWVGQAGTIGSSRTLVNHLNCLQELLKAALTPSTNVKTDAVAYAVPLAYESPCFVAHRLTREFLKPCGLLNLFAVEVTEDADATRFDVVEPHVKVMVKFLSDKFTDSVNGDRSLCLPILHTMHTLILCPQARDTNVLRTALKSIARGMMTLEETDASGIVVPGLIGEWRTIQDLIDV